MASIDKYLEDPEFANWVKSGLALNITNEVLRPFVVKEITKLHQSIVKTLPRGVSCTGCSVDTACPKGICDEIQREIENKHWYPNPSFTNTCTGRWSADPWEIAKCYMPPLQGYKRSAASDADFSACINVIINCKHFQAFGTSDPRGKETDLSKSRDFRNLVMHGSSQKVTENDMKENLDILINILNMIKAPETEADTKEAREKIEMTIQLKIKFEDAIEVTKNAIEANADNLDKDEDQVQRERLLVNFEAGCRKALCRLTEEHISIQEGNLSVAAFLSKIGIFAERKDLCSRHQNMLFPKTGTHAAIREWDLFVYCFILEELDLYEPIGNAVSIFVREVKKIRNRIVIDASGVTQDDLSELCDYLIDTDLNTDITEIFNKDFPDVDVICSFNILGSWWREEEDYGKKPISKKQLNIKKQIMEDVDKRLSENKDTIKREILEMLGYRGEHVTLQGDNAAVLDTACEVRVSGCDEETANATQEHITFPDNNDIERNEAIDHFRQQRNLLKVTPEKGSIILNVKCSSITNVLDFWDSCIDGRAVEALSKVRDYYRRYFKCDTLKFDVILTKKVVSRCVNEIVKGLPSHFERLIVEVTDEVRGILADKAYSHERSKLTNSMAETPYKVLLTDEQLLAVKAMFTERGWTMTIETNDLYQQRKEAADDYVDIAGGRSCLTGDDGRSSPIRMRPQSIKKAGENGMTFILDRSQDDLQKMKRVRSSFKKTIKSKPLTPNSQAPDRQHPKWRLSTFTQLNETDVLVDSDLTFTHFVLSTENTIKILTKLSTAHVQNVSRVPVRIVLLVDRSGSMLHKLGRDGRHTKITKVKHFVDNLIQTLDDGDMVSLVTFGEEADVLFPLVKLNKQSRDNLRGTLRSLDRGSMSQVTNLSIGLRRALKVFYDETHGDADVLLASKNSILVFTDGDINSGTQNTNDLIHEVRQNIRQMVPALDEAQSQWVTISVVNTGTSVSEQAYTLSKTCSSDAYYYIDKATEDPEAELFLPVLLRKTAVAWNISYTIEAFHGIMMIDEKCTRDNRVRSRRSVTGRKEKEQQRSYFLYDFPAGATREFGVYASWNGLQQLGGVDDDAALFNMRVEFTNIQGQRYWQEMTVTKWEITEAMRASSNTEASQAALKHEMKLISGEVLRSAAELLKTGEKQRSQAVIQDGQKDLQALLNAFGEKSKEGPNEKRAEETVLMGYAKCVVDNMSSLIETIESASQGAAWNKVKAVSTAIVRESPNTTESLVDGNILCPFPTIDHMETGGLKGPLERMQAKNKANKRITFGNLDSLLENELH